MGQLLILLIILGFSSYRITRFFIVDTFFEGTRERLHLFLANQANKNGKLRIVWEKTYDWSSCTWCFGFWVSIALYSIYIWQCPIWFSRFDWVYVFAIAGLQGILHAWEPDEE